MRKTTCLLPNVLFAIGFALALYSNPSHMAHAQEDGVIPASYQSGGFFSRELGTALRFNYHTQGYGTQDGVFSLGGMKVFNMEGATFFLDGQGTLSDDFGGGFNLGAGYRQLATLGNKVDSERIIGASFWTDGQSSVNDNFFTQLGFGLESLGDKYDLRLNGHFPLDREKEGDASLIAADEAFYSGNNLFGSQETFGVDTALDVLDGEVAVRVADLEAWGFAGAYYLGGGNDDTAGYRLGVRGYAVPDVAVSFAVTDDDIYDTNFLFGITWFIGRTHKGNAPCGTLLDRFREPVMRNDFIAMTNRQETRVSGDALLIDGSTDLVSIVHVDSSAGAGGDGTFENPYSNLSDANGAGSNVNDIILAHGGSTFSNTDGQILLQENQRLIGEGLDQDDNTITHFVQTNVGAIALPETAVDAQALMRPAINGAGTAGAIIELVDGATVDNFTISNADIGILANGVAVPTGNTIANVLIENSATGINFTDVTGAAVIGDATNANIRINGSTTAGLVVDGGDESVAFNGQINDTIGNSMVVQNRTGGVVSFDGMIDDDLSGANTSTGVLIENNTDATVSYASTSTLDIHVDGAGENGMLVQNNTNTSVNVAGATDITATGDAQATSFVGNDATSALSFSDLNASAVDGNTVDVQGPGTVTISSVTTTDPDRGIENTGTGDAFFNDGTGGTATITVNSNIDNSGGGNAVAMSNRAEANDAFFNGNVTDESDGINITDNSDGIMGFVGEVLLTSTGGSNSLTMLNNEGATVSFTDIRASAVDGNTIDVTGGGTLTITDPNATNSIANTGTGNAVSIVGDDDLAATGDAIVSIGAPVTNENGGRAVEISRRTSNDVEFNDTVTDDGNGLLIANNTGGTIDFDEAVTSTTAGANRAIDLDTNSGTTITFNGVMATTTGTGTAFRGVGGGNLVVASPNTPGDNTIQTQNGIGLDLQDMTVDAGGVTFEVFNVSGANAATNGVNLRNIDGTGQVVLGGTDATHGGTIASSGTAINIDNVANVSITGVDVGNNVGGNAGGGVVVTNQAAGSIALFDDMELRTADGDGINVSANDDGIVTFNTVEITTDATGAGDGIEIANADGSLVAVNVTDATINADGTGRGFFATGGGTMSVTGTNEINSTGATAFVVDNVESLTATDVTINNTTAAGVQVTNQDNATDSVALTNFDVNTTSAAGVTIESNSDGTITATNLTAESTAGNTVVVNNNTGGTVGLSTMTVESTDGDTVSLTNNTGATVNVTSMEVEATGSGNAFTATGGGTLSTTGTNNVTANTGSGVDIQNMTIAAGNVGFANVDVTNGTSGVNLDTLTGGTVTVGNGTMTTSGTAITINDVDNAAINNVTVNNTGGSGMIATNSAGDTLTVSNLDVTTVGGQGVNVSGGTFSSTGTNTITTNIGTGLTLDNTTIAATGASFNSVDVTAATNGIVLNNATGGLIRVGAAAATGTDGDGGTLTTTGTGITVTGVTNAVFNDVTVNSTTNDAVLVNHTSTNLSDITFDNLTLVTVAGGGNGVVVNDNGTGELDVIVQNSNINTTASDTIGFVFNAGANTGRVDVTVAGTTLAANDSQALLADIDQGSGNVQFLLNENNAITNDSAANAAADFSMTAARVFNLTVGDGTNTPPLDANTFTNANAGGTAFSAILDNVAGDLNLDIRGNTASGGSIDFLVGEVNGDFGVVDRDATINANTNNSGIFNLNGGVFGDFDDLAGPIDQVD